MAITLSTPAVAELDALVDDLASWQVEGAPVQIHPGDLGWHWRLGAPALAAALRVWRRDGRPVALGVVDDGLIRMAINPTVGDDAGFAAAIVDDLEDPDGVLGSGSASAEVRYGPAVRSRLAARGWSADESWTPLVRDLASPVEPVPLRIEVAGPGTVADRVAVQRAAFANSTFTTQRWQVMADASPYRRARCLIGYDDAGSAVAAVTVWSAGPGRPGLLEPMGVHRDHRGRGHGRAITVAAAAALRELGSSSATVCTRTANVSGVATYAAAGFEPLPPVVDFRRPSR